MDKVVATAAEAVADVPDGARLAVGGFGLSGVPNVLIQALYERGVSGPGVVSDNCGAMESVPAIGHPLGASGARLAGTVAHQLARKGSGTGVATLCIGVGQGLALVLER
ncbi:CoA-transferase [Streptomyces sp. HUAS ZL42]|uniref:CoA-transferase n=1 Tax=Streptomyces sp. HUAS ZL42 TaxID=3231715 RepID=UPI00345E24A3